ncbi:MAG: polysaccharide deacetylase family protein [Anaerovibrio sp.]|nr:polysaccharide deacetylase family protein [Anaerovibrio sp.]MCR5175393.1 polysaccharide deacetylase family protein [Anaerovibrio sp.]
MDVQSFIEKYRIYIIIGILVLAVAIIVMCGKKPQVKVPENEVGNDIRAVMVINYHKVDNVFHSLSIQVDDFDKQMQWLQKHGYHSITPDQLYEFVANGAELPENPVLITFDDGYRDNYVNAYPIMQKYGFVGTIFVVTSFLDKYPNYMTWDQARILEANGFSIESHTVTHKSMTEASDEQIMEELVRSKETIKDKLGKEADYIAYPTGTYNLHIAQMVKDAGYKGAFTIRYDTVNRNSNVYALERVPIFHTENTNKDFLERIQYLPLVNKDGWIKK